MNVMNRFASLLRRRKPGGESTGESIDEPIGKSIGESIGKSIGESIGKSIGKSTAMHAIGIVDVVSQFTDVHLYKSGLWACCPFHATDNDSMQIDADANKFHCRECGIAGTPVGFVMMMNKVEKDIAIEQILEMRDKNGKELFLLDC